MTGEQLSFEERNERIKDLATDASARVMVFIDGQNLYKRCQELFGHPTCHPHLLAEILAGPRRGAPVSTRFYTGQPDRSVDETERRKRQALDRRLASLRKAGITTVTRDLRYTWAWRPSQDEEGRLKRPGPTSGPVKVWTDAYRRPREKGIDLAIGLEVIEFALVGSVDVAIIVSLDTDLQEIPKALKRLTHHFPHPIRIEAAVPTSSRQKRLAEFNYTHQITREVFERIRDDTNYRVHPNDWVPPRHPRTLADL